MKGLVKIVTPPGGAGFGTKVYTAEGAEITGITELVIRRIGPESLVEAEITVIVDGFTIEAHPLLSMTSLECAAAARGLKLVRKTA